MTESGDGSAGVMGSLDGMRVDGTPARVAGASGAGGSDDNAATSAGNEPIEGSAGSPGAIGDAGATAPPVTLPMCVDGVNSYSCRCAPNFHGASCEVEAFRGLGTNPEAVGSCLAVALSADGTTVVGNCGLVAGFKWTVEGFSTLPGEDAFAFDVTQNGLMVVGTMSVENGTTRAVRWIGSAAPERLDPGTDDAVETYTYPVAVSADGSYVAVTVQPGDSPDAQRWQLFGSTPSVLVMDAAREYADVDVRGLSADGSTAFGVAEGPDAAWKWKIGTGLVPLLGAGGTTDRRPSVLGANVDGSVIVGASMDQAVRWLDPGGLPESLGVSGAARAVSANGAIIVGGSDSGAFLWTQQTSARPLSELLAEANAELDGWILTDAVDISLDGKVVVGVGTHNGVEESWIARLP